METVVGYVGDRSVFVSFLVEEVVFLREGPGSPSEVSIAEDNEPFVAVLGQVPVGEEVYGCDKGKDYQSQDVGDLVGCELGGDTGVVVWGGGVIVLFVVGVGVWHVAGVVGRAG